MSSLIGLIQEIEMNDESNDDDILLSTYYMPVIMLGALHTL